MNSYGRGLAAVGGSGLGSSGAITARSVIAQFQQFLERSAAQDAQKAYELGHKEALVECAEILLEEGQGLETTEEYTQLPKKDLFSLGNAHRLVEESQTAPMQGPDFDENRFRVRDEEFVKYLGMAKPKNNRHVWIQLNRPRSTLTIRSDFLTQYTIIPHLQRQALQNYNSGRWYKVKAVEKEVDVDPTAEDDRLVISAWEKKVQRKFQQDTVHRVIPTEYKGPSVWWNIVGKLICEGPRNSYKTGGKNYSELLFTALEANQSRYTTSNRGLSRWPEESAPSMPFPTGEIVLANVV